MVEAKDRKLSVPTMDQFNSVTSSGVHWTVEGKTVLIGKRSLLEEKKVRYLPSLDDRVDELQRQGRTKMYIAVERQFARLVAVSGKKVL